MRRLSNDDKETIGIFIMAAVMIMLFIITIADTISRAHVPSPKKYDEICITNYVKYPLKECYYKEAE